MTTSRTPRSRFAMLLGAAALGLLASLFSLRAGSYAQAAFSLLVMLAFGAILGFSRGEWVTAQTGEADERQQSLNSQAISFAYYAVLAVAIVGLFTELGRNQPGAFTLVCAVGGFTHGLSLAVLHRLR